MLRGPCGNGYIKYDLGLAEDLESSSGPYCSLVSGLLRPPPRLYVRVNTLKVSVEKYLANLRDAGLEFRVDEDIPEAIWHPVEGPIPQDLRGKVVVADKQASESVLMGSDLYAPGVLKAKGVERGDEVVIVTPWGRPVGGGIAVMSWREIRDRRRGLAVRVTKPIYRAPRVRELPGFEEGLIYGQSITSMYVARAIGPLKEGLVIDMTAAPGGKVSHLAQISGNRVRLIAVDRPSKVQRLTSTLTRLGVRNFEVLGLDSRYLTKRYPSLAGKADVVLLDPPCTNIGVIPKAFDEKTLRDSASYSVYQGQLLSEAYRLLKKGGLLAYSTCTLTSLENEAVIERALHNGFEIHSSWQIKPSRGWSTGLGWRWSPNRSSTPGFFVSLLIKR